MKQTKLFTTGKQKQRLALLPALLTVALLIGVVTVYAQESWHGSTTSFGGTIGGYASQIIRVEAWGAGGGGGRGPVTTTGGAGGGGGAFAGATVTNYFRAGQSAKARLPISVTPSGMTTLVTAIPSKIGRAHV